MRLTLLTGTALAFDNKLKYPINGRNIPERGNVYRVKEGSKVTIPLVIPSDGEKTYVVFTDDYENADKIRQSRQACKNGDDTACNEDLKIYGNIMYQAANGKLRYPGIGGGQDVPSQEAKIDKENSELVINNMDMKSGGFWWSVFGHFDQAESISDSSLTYKHDKMSLVQVVDSCKAQVMWDEGIDMQKFGWHNGQFNNYGFAPGDTFASCHFKSSPPSYISWDSDEIVTERKANQELAIVPDHLIRAESLSCSVKPFKEFEPKFEFDECADVNMSGVVLSPPNMLDYSYSDTSTERVFSYYKKDETITTPTFTCPVLETAPYVYVVGSDTFQSENLVDHGMEAVPMDGDHHDHNHEDDLAFGGTEEGSLGERYIISVRPEKAQLGMTEFRCAYYNDEGILGYSKPFVLTVYGDDMTTPSKPKMSWGESVKESRLVKQDQPLTNIANCWQTTTGPPSLLQFGFRNQNGQEMLFKYPEHPIDQHSISLNMKPIGTQNKASIYCESFTIVGTEIVSEQFDLGQIEVIQKPFKLIVDARKQNDMWTVSCLADTSKHDKVEVALSLDKKFKKTLGPDGSVTFNITGEFDERDQKKFQDKGTNCIYTSEQFPEDKFQSRVFVITTYVEIPRGFMWGFVLMFCALAVFIGMCFGFNSQNYEPVKQDV